MEQVLEFQKTNRRNRASSRKESIEIMQTRQLKALSHVAC